jgi:hypothetical protein
MIHVFIQLLSTADRPVKHRAVHNTIYDCIEVLRDTACLQPVEDFFLQCAGNSGAEKGAQSRAKDVQPTRNNHSDQSGDQAVFNGGYAFFVVQELLNALHHFVHNVFLLFRSSNKIRRMAVLLSSYCGCHFESPQRLNPSY